MDAKSEIEDDEIVSKYKMKSIITAPLVFSGKILGALYLSNRHVKGLFSQENFDLLKAFAVESAISIENARLIIQVQEKTRVEQEMALAKKIQTVLLPKDPIVTGYEITGFMEPADEVGGDYYDIVNVDGFDWIIIGDVSGHGITAGLVMMMVQTSIRTVLRMDPDISPMKLLEYVNEVIAYNIKQFGESKYMTITAIAAGKNGKFTFSGLHQDIFIYRAKTKKLEEVETSGMWIGIMDSIKGMLSNSTVKLNQGDSCLLYTDGLTEAQDSSDSMFSEEKLANIFEEHAAKNESPEEIKQGIIKNLKEYKILDDVTMVILKRNA